MPGAWPPVTITAAAPKSRIRLAASFASAVAASLALGRSLAEAAERAQQFVAGAIRHGLAIGRGSGPIDHFWQTRA